MITLNDTEKEIVKSGQILLAKNDIEQFYDNRVWNALYKGATYDNITHINQWFEENGVDTLKYCKRTVPFVLKYCTKAVKQTIPQGIETIDDLAFASCFNLEEIIIPESVTNIRAYAFENCKNLKEIHLSKNIDYIADHAFHKCSKELKFICEFDPEDIGWYEGEHSFKNQIIRI